MPAGDPSQNLISWPRALGYNNEPCGGSTGWSRGRRGRGEECLEVCDCRAICWSGTLCEPVTSVPSPPLPMSARP